MRELKREWVVRPQDSARAMGSGDLEVLASPALVAMAENLSKELCLDFLKEGETTVGTEFVLRHIKATAVGETIELSVRLSENQGRAHQFEIRASHGQDLIATATHQRVVVNEERFLERLKN